MNRELWKNRGFEKNSPTQYPCPNCNIGILKPTLVKSEITGEGEFMTHNNYHDGIEHIFSGLFKCSKESCGEIISFGGVCNKDIRTGYELPNGEWEERYITYYEPKFFYPNLRLFKIPKEIPKVIKEQIDFSFSHFFNDLSACANRIRTTIEVILDEIGASNYHMPIDRSRCPIRNSTCSLHSSSTRRKKKKFRNLHQRIEYLSRKKNKKLGTLLLANKIIGNEGSHNGLVKIEDILDAYEILEEILNILFIKPNLKIENLAIEITTLKKPRSKK